MNKLLNEINKMHSVPQGAYSIRENGISKINSTDDIIIIPHKNKKGIKIYVKSGTKNKSLHLPVIVSQGGFTELVYNDFYIEDNCDVTIVGSCGIHNNTNNPSSHNGKHTFHIGKNCNVKYLEKHLAVGNNSTNTLNPVTKIHIKDNSTMTIETVQLGGVSYSKRSTVAKLENNAILNITEKILTDNTDFAQTNFKVNLNGENSSVKVVSRSVAKGNSNQSFNSKIMGNNKCFGHIECDGIVTNNASLSSTPTVACNHPEASLSHEATIGRIAGEQLIKLMTLGLTQKQAEDMIINGFLR